MISRNGSVTDVALSGEFDVLRTMDSEIYVIRDRDENVTDDSI